MTDSENIKAFECCEANGGQSPQCDACPYHYIDENNDPCYIEARREILKILNRQQAEIETLKAHEEKEHQYCKNVCEPKYKEEIEWLKKLLAEEEAKHTQCAKRFYKEGIKDFAKRLKDYYINHKRYKRPYAHTLVDVLFDVIDNLVKEMVGDNDV